MKHHLLPDNRYAANKLFLFFSLFHVFRPLLIPSCHQQVSTHSLVLILVKSNKIQIFFPLFCTPVFFSFLSSESYMDLFRALSFLTPAEEL